MAALLLLVAAAHGGPLQPEGRRPRCFRSLPPRTARTLRRARWRHWCGAAWRQSSAGLMPSSWRMQSSRWKQGARCTRCLPCLACSITAELFAIV